MRNEDWPTIPESERRFADAEFLDELIDRQPEGASAIERLYGGAIGAVALLREDLFEALFFFAHHNKFCSTVDNPESEPHCQCNCGYDRLLSGYPDLVKRYEREAEQYYERLADRQAK